MASARWGSIPNNDDSGLWNIDIDSDKLSKDIKFMIDNPSDYVNYKYFYIGICALFLLLLVKMVLNQYRNKKKIHRKKVN